MFKKLLFTVMAMTIILSINTIVFAQEINYTSEHEEQIKLKEKIVEIVSSDITINERDELLTNLLANNPLNTTTNTKSTTPVDTIKVDDSLSIDFYSNGDFGILQMDKLEENNSSKKNGSVYATVSIED